MGRLGVVVGPGLLSRVLPHLPRVVCAAASGAGTHEQLSGAVWLRLAAVSVERDRGTKILFLSGPTSGGKQNLRSEHQVGLELWSMTMAEESGMQQRQR